MDWLLGRVDSTMIVPSAVLVLWSALFIFAYFLMKKQDARLIAWGAALAVLSLQPLVHWSAALSVYFACGLFWCIQLAGAMILVGGLLRNKPGERLVRSGFLLGGALTVLALAALYFVRTEAGFSAWLAAAFIAQGAMLLVGTIICAAKNWRALHIPAYVALLLFTGADGYCAASLLINGDIVRFPVVYALDSLLVCNTLSFALLIQSAVESFRINKRLDYIVESSTLGLAFTDTKGRVQKINGRLMEMFGIGPETIKYGSTTLDGIGLGETVKACIQKGCEEEAVLDYEALRRAGIPTRGTGHIRLVVSAHAVDELGGGLKGWHIQAEDVTQIRETLSELTENRCRMELVLRAAGAYEYSREGYTIQAEALFRALGYGFSARNHINLMEIVHPQDQVKIRGAVEQGIPRPGENFSADIRLKNAEGAYVWHHLSSQYVCVNGRAVSLGIAFNIDLQKRMESHASQCDRLAAAGQLANGLAHDINNHLSTIHTSLGMLTAVSDEALRKKYISYMQEAVANASATLKRLVGFSKGDAEETGPVAVGEMLSSSVELLRRSAGVRNTVEYEEYQGNEVVLGNYFDLQNAVLNIGLNARDALPEKDGWIRVRSWVSRGNPLKPEAAYRWYFISIRDNGCGMSDDVQKRIFDPFFTTKPKGRGTGLGLYTTYGSVLRCGGTISVESAPGKGTEFVMAFPLMEEKAETPETAQEPVSS